MMSLPLSAFPSFASVAEVWPDENNLVSNVKIAVRWGRIEAAGHVLYWQVVTAVGDLEYYWD